MLDWIMRKLFPKMATEKDVELAELDRRIAETRVTINRLSRKSPFFPGW